MADEQRNLTASFVADTSGFPPEIDELIQKLKSLNGEFQDNQTKLKALERELKEYQQKLDELNRTTRNGADANEAQLHRMHELSDSIANCNTQIGSLRAAQTNIRSQINSTNRELVAQQNALNGTRTVLSEASDSARRFGDVLKANLASSVVTAAFQKTLSFFRSFVQECYNAGAAFDSGMSQVAAISGATGSDLEALTDKAKALGSSTKFTATEAAEALNYMAMAGWKTEDMLSGIDGVLGLAAASGEDLATTSDIVTDALSAFGLSAKDCGHFADVLAAASSNANTNVSMMGETFKYAASIAGAMGYTAEDTALAIGLMANSGIKASQAGTALREIFTVTASDIKVTGDAIGEVIVKTQNADGTMREFSDILTDLRAAFSELTESEKSAAAESIAGKNAMSGFLALMNAGEADVQKLSDAIANCDGMAASMAETMQDNLQGAVTKFNSALEGVQIAVYDKFKDGCTDAVKIFTDAMNDISASVENGGRLGDSIENLGESFADAAREIALIVKEDLPDFIDGLSKAVTFVIEFREEIGAAAAGFVTFKSAMAVGNIVTAAISSFKKLATTTREATSAQEGFNAAASANPYGLIAAGVGIAVGAITEFEAHLDDCNEKTSDLIYTVGKLTEATEEYREKASTIGEISREFERITKSEEDNQKVTEQLRKLQDELVDKFGYEAEGIDLVTDAYANQADILEQLNGLKDQYNEYAAKSAESGLEMLKKAESNSTAITIDSGMLKNEQLFGELVSNPNLNVQKAQSAAATGVGNALSGLTGVAGVLTKMIGGNKKTLYLEGSFEERADDLREIYRYLTIEKGLTASDPTVAQVNELLKQMEQNIQLEKQYTDILNNSPTSNAYDYDPNFVGPRQLTGTSQKSSQSADAKASKTQDEDVKSLKTYDEDAFNEQKKLLDAKHQAGYLSEQEYYDQLKALRDKYLQEDTLAWYNATAAINSIYDKWTSAAVKSTSTVKSSLDEVQTAYKRTLEAIDAEIERHNREKSDLEFQEQINAIDEKLNYGRLDDFSKYELEKERQRLIDEHNEVLYSRQAEDAKSLVSDAYDAQQLLKNADYGTKEYTLAVGDYTEKLEELTTALRGIMGVQNNSTTNNTSIDESTRNQFVNVVLQAANRSNEQLVDELIKALHSGI